MSQPELNTVLALLETMWRIRAFEETAAEAHAAGEIPGVIHLSIGQEAVAAGVCAHLDRSDYVASTHRGHGHALAKGAASAKMMAELFGRASGTCGGKGGSMHIADFEVGMLGANGVVGGGIGIAIGAAHGARLLGRAGVAVTFFGDGGLNRGPLYEGLNWAQLYKLPVLFVCENNGFAAFSRSTQMVAGPGPVERARAFGLESLEVDGNNVLDVYAAAGALIERARRDGMPAFLHTPTYRIKGHTIFDQAKYRPQSEVDAALLRDPIVRTAEHLLARGVTRADLNRIERRARDEMQRARTDAVAAPFAAAAAALTDVQTAGAPA